ncbi:MAG: hypothetical protein KAT00_01505 [Planctomycetes bacterium]|nr:hypothetical protein [Planctomycetota bacterium]
MKKPMSISVDGSTAIALTITALKHDISRSAYVMTIVKMFVPFDAPALARFLVERYPDQIDELIAEIVRWVEREGRTEGVREVTEEEDRK